MATLVATVQNITLQGESTAKQRTQSATLARRSVTGNRSAGSLTRPQENQVTNPMLTWRTKKGI